MRLAEQFWTRFGARIFPADLSDWPQRAVTDFTAVMVAEAAHRAERVAAAPRPGDQPPAATQAAFDALREKMLAKSEE